LIVTTTSSKCHLSAIYGVCAEADSRIAVRTFYTISESFRKSL
jgi:hypothetical protein